MVQTKQNSAHLAICECDSDNCCRNSKATIPFCVPFMFLIQKTQTSDITSFIVRAKCSLLVGLSKTNCVQQVFCNLFKFKLTFLAVSETYMFSQQKTNGMKFSSKNVEGFVVIRFTANQTGDIIFMV